MCMHITALYWTESEWLNYRSWAYGAMYLLQYYQMLFAPPYVYCQIPESF